MANLEKNSINPRSKVAVEFPHLNEFHEEVKRKKLDIVVRIAAKKYLAHKSKATRSKLDKTWQTAVFPDKTKKILDAYLEQTGGKFPKTKGSSVKTETPNDDKGKGE